LPAINYLQRLYNADLFVFLDTVQRQSRGWENRNKILQSDNEIWITIPVSSSSREAISKSFVSGMNWIDEHKHAIQQTYKWHPHFSNEILNECYKDIKDVATSSNCNYAKIIVHILLNICTFFGFIPNVVFASEYSDESTTRVDKLVQILKNVGGDVYVSGANGKEYCVVSAFSGTNINVVFHRYVYPRYLQHSSTYFHPWMCFFDVLFNLGYTDTLKFITEKWELTDD
jgi:hypothetical protein